MITQFRLFQLQFDQLTRHNLVDRRREIQQKGTNMSTPLMTKFVICYAEGCPNKNEDILQWQALLCPKHGISHGIPPCNCEPPFRLLFVDVSLNFISLYFNVVPQIHYVSFSMTGKMISSSENVGFSQFLFQILNSIT